MNHGFTAPFSHGNTSEWYSSRSFRDLFRFAKRLQINSQLLAFLVQVTPFQTQRPRHIRHVKVVPSNLRQQHFPFKRSGPVRKRSRGFNRSAEHTSELQSP